MNEILQKVYHIHFIIEAIGNDGVTDEKIVCIYTITKYIVIQ